MTGKYCSECGEWNIEAARFCGWCGRRFGRHMLAQREPVPLSEFKGLRVLSAGLADQKAWLRRGSLLEPVHELIDSLSLRSTIRRATDQQVEQILAGYQGYAREKIEQAIDPVRHERQLGDAQISLEIKRRDLEVEDIFADREHLRRLERLREEHRHESEMMQLRAQLELVNASIQAFNRLKMIRWEAEVEGEAQIEQMKKLVEIIEHSFTALAEIDASQIEYTRHLKEELNFENLEDAQSLQLMEELIEAIRDRITKGVTQFGDKPGVD